MVTRKPESKIPDRRTRAGRALAAFEAFEGEFAKHFGPNVLRRSNEVPKYEVVSTGSITLDYAMGSGGYIEGRITEMWGPDGTGKGHPLDHPVLTPEGWRPIGDLVEGDLVIAKDGLATEVTDIYDRGELDVFTVTFNDGATVTCDADHLWTVKASKGWVTYDTRTLMNEKDLQDPQGGNRYQIPLVERVEHPRLDLPVDPYILGALLANGYLDGTPVIRTNDEHVRQTVFDAASRLGETVKEATAQTSTAMGIAVHGMRDRLRFLGLYGTRSASKFIPEQYLRSSSAQRTKLLAALMDCDGSSGAKTRYHTTSRRLAEGVVDLVRSLGGIARLYELDRVHSDGRGYTEFSVGILLPTCPFSTPAKTAVWKSPTKLSRRMVSIEPAGRAEVRCIRVAAEDHLYVTKDYVVTHNTTLSLIAIANAQAKYPDRMCAFIDVEHKLDLGWAVKLGVDLTRMYVVQPPSAEDVADIVKALISSDVVSFIVLDSIGAMTANEEFDKDANEVSVGTTPKVITRMVKIAGSRLQQHRCGLLLINQVRANLGYGADTTTGGGFARAHSTTQRLKVRRAMKGEIKLGSGDDAVVIGFKIAVKVEKNQAASPGRTAMVTIINQTTDKHPEYGVSDRPGEAFEVGKKTGVIGRRGPTYILPDGSEHKGEVATRAYLEQSPDLVETIRQQLLAMIADGGATKAIPADDEDDEAAAEFAGDDEVPAVDLDAAAAAPLPAEDDEEMDV